MPDDAAACVAVWRGGSAFTLESVQLPSPGPREVVVRVTLATVCGSDHHTVTGRRSSPCPGVLGHEGVGVVVDAGHGAPARVGERVVWSVVVSCGDCDRCHAGLTAKCRSVRKIGHEAYDDRWPLSGTYASHILLPAGTTLVPVPDTLPDAVAAPSGCATATVMAAAERAGELRGKRVLVSGAGMLGLTACAAAADAGAASVVVVDPVPDRRMLAKSFGATTLFEPGQGLPLADVALELSGVGAAVATCLRTLDVGGVAVLVGSVAPVAPVGMVPERLVRGWQTVAGVHNYEPRHLERAVAFLAAGEWPWADLVADPVGLDRIGELLASPTSRPRASVRP